MSILSKIGHISGDVGGGILDMINHASGFTPPPAQLGQAGAAIAHPAPLQQINQATGFQPFMPHPTQPQLPSQQTYNTIDAINQATGSPYGDFTFGAGQAPQYSPAAQSILDLINQSTGFNPLRRR